MCIPIPNFIVWIWSVLLCILTRFVAALLRCNRNPENRKKYVNLELPFKYYERITQSSSLLSMKKKGVLRVGRTGLQILYNPGFSPTRRAWRSAKIFWHSTRPKRNRIHLILIYYHYKDAFNTKSCSVKLFWWQDLLKSPNTKNLRSTCF